MKYRMLGILLFPLLLEALSFASSSPLILNVNGTTSTAPSQISKETLIANGNMLTATVATSSATSSSLRISTQDMRNAKVTIPSADSGGGGGGGSATRSGSTESTRTTTVENGGHGDAVTTTTTTEFVIPHRMPSQLEEKLESLSCDLPLLPRDSRLWKGNETHELLLPITIPADYQQQVICSNDAGSGSKKSRALKNCGPPILSWESAIEIQSGDVLLVRIDDTHLARQDTIINRRDQDNERTTLEPPTAVYQVTRSGHDNCDVTEGVLLDITPLKIDGRKVFTLYDKDLTEGMNLLIVVSERWGRQCIRLKVVVKSDNCGENEDCSGKGLCYSNVSMEGYECQCCPGFVGPHCEEQDACYPSPCKNNGICVDITQGHDGSTFQCLCPYGYTGKTCEEETDPCTSMPCQNGGNCSGNVTQYKCECPKGFSGIHCQHNAKECESSPCVHGICVDREDGYKCYCQPGFTGTHCEYEYNECESSPCLNGGTCTDRIDGYSCSCGRGFTGKRCQIKVDLCEPNPCPEPKYCLDRGNEYSCECPQGFNKPDCLIPSRAACSTNPCTNGGTCWSSIDSFYCACKPGFTGKTCEEEFIVEKIGQVESPGRSKAGPEMPMFVHLDHLHNVYIAAGTLMCAFIMVAIIVTVCHCRVNKTYKNFSIKRYPFFGCEDDQPNPEPAHPVNTEWFTGKDKAPMATPSRSLPSLDTTDMYYTLDFSDNQCSPLIQSTY